MKKIKLFLGGYVNKQNAQNLNCNSLCKYLDKDKYSIFTMSRDDGNIDITDIEEFATIFTFNHKIKFLKSWNYMKALYFCDVLYLPRRDGLFLILTLNKIFKKKIFLTVEALFDDYILDKFNNDKKRTLKTTVNTINKVPYVYSITNFMREYNNSRVGLKTLDKILYLGVDLDKFVSKNNISSKLENIIFIGNDMQRKGINEFLNLAESHIDLNFHIVGSTKSIDIKSIEKNYKNVVIHGIRNPTELNIILQNIDLHILPSKSEGFGKVTFETAAVGIPSIVYGCYGAKEWIKHNENGFIVNNYNEMEQLVKKLKGDGDLLYLNSINAIELAKKFSWENLISNWESEIDRIYNDR